MGWWIIINRVEGCGETEQQASTPHIITQQPPGHTAPQLLESWWLEASEASHHIQPPPNNPPPTADTAVGTAVESAEIMLSNHLPPTQQPPANTGNNLPEQWEDRLVEDDLEREQPPTLPPTRPLGKIPESGWKAGWKAVQEAFLSNNHHPTSSTASGLHNGWQQKFQTSGISRVEPLGGKRVSAAASSWMPERRIRHRSPTSHPSRP
jgi:hypothetical protein